PCTSGVCPQGMVCETSGGDNGYCVMTNSSPVSNPTPRGNFDLSVTAVSMTNVSPVGSFQIINNSPVTQRFQIRKLGHEITYNDGSIETAVRRRSGLIDPAVCDALGDDFPCFCTDDSHCVDFDGERDERFQCQLGSCRPFDCPSGGCPLDWLSINAIAEDPARGQQLEVTVAAGEAKTIELSTPSRNENVARWSGELMVTNPTLGERRISVSYIALPEGQWMGQMVYLAQFGTKDLEPWLANKADSNLLEQVGNALIQRWGAFRGSDIRISWDEFVAVLTATQSGSWNYANVKEACRAQGLTGACYLYELGGVAQYTTDLEDFPIPSGPAVLPMTMNLRVDQNDASRLVGRIVSEKSLQYAGSPEVRLNLGADPSECNETYSAANPGDTSCRCVAGACLVFAESMTSDIFVGGRYNTTSSDISCSQRGGSDQYTLQATPWLVPGFKGDSELDLETGLRYSYECRDSYLPFNTQLDSQAARENTSLALSNPIPDGRGRRRQIRLLDGALVNQNTLFIFFEEHFDSFLGANDDAGFSAYGYMYLERNPIELDDTDTNNNGVFDIYEGTVGSDPRTDPNGVLAVSCEQGILDSILNPGENLGNRTEKVVRAIIDGVVGDDPEMLDNQSNEQPHYLCVETGLIDGGPFAHAPLPTREACPPESEVIYFTLSRDAISSQAIASLPCQQDRDPNAEGVQGSCVETVNRWRDNGYLVQDPPIWRCTDSNEVYCDSNRLDLLADKSFFASTEPDAVFVPLQSIIDDAFRYKTRFRTRRGDNPGFTPELCVPNSDSVPYCYDPDLITSVVQRTDCLLEVWNSNNLYNRLSPQMRNKLNDYLEVNFSMAQQVLPDNTIQTRDGFEQLNAELLIMLGDEAYTQAFASRFDLAGASTIAFEGSLFEEEGIDLAGIVGYEMYSLYLATQYYEMTLDRFYSQSPLVWQSINYGSGDRNFVTPSTVIRYFDRLIRASTQKSKAWAEIANRYNRLDRPDLARRVT
ncbi:MAG: hypothetical protein AAFS10_11025, partial [Myxococcota bacterium]